MESIYVSAIANASALPAQEFNLQIGIKIDSTGTYIKSEFRQQGTALLGEGLAQNWGNLQNGYRVKRSDRSYTTVAEAMQAGRDLINAIYTKPAVVVTNNPVQFIR